MNPTATTIREHDRDAPERDETDTATFALGCFWGPEAQFGAMDGVVRTRVGYAGGAKLNPTYHDLGDHTEVFQVDYDPYERSYADLLAVVFENHHPDHQTQKTQYQNITFYDSPGQKETLESFLKTNGLDAETVETRIERLTRFYLAESYHQKYNLKAKQSLLDPFEETGYDDEELRESPAAAKLNGYAGGHDVSEEHDLGVLLNRNPSA
jgi:peptide-methionine (S)-S-oxide reductase